MRKTLSLAALLALVLVLPRPALAAFDDLEKSFDAFYKTGLDTSAAVAVENLTLQKDAMTFTLKKGILVPMLPMEGEITGAMFVGEGTASLTPPTPMDAWFLKKHSGTERFRLDFQKLYLRFGDGTHRLFPKPIPGTTQAVIASSMDAIVAAFQDCQRTTDDWIDTNTFDMDMSFLESRTGGLGGLDFFYGMFWAEGKSRLIFLYDPTETLETYLGVEDITGNFKIVRALVHVHKKEDYQDGKYLLMPASDVRDAVDVTKTEMAVSVPTTKSLHIDAKITFKPLTEPLQSVRFSLLNQFGDLSWRNQGRPIVVESVTDEAGAPLPYLHKRDQLLIRFPRPFKKSESISFRVKAREDTIIQLTAESYFIYNTYPWFPQYGYLGGRYAFDFSIEVKEPLRPIGSGHIVREWENKEERMNGIQLRMDDEVQFPSILFGRFLRDSGVFNSTASNRDIAITVSAFPTMTVTITDPYILELIGAPNPITATLTVPQGKMKGILEESKEIIKFYEMLYGPFPYGDLQIAQMAPQLGFGQAPPSLIQLTGLAFLSQAELESDFLHGFLSHEIGHQYWGHTIGWATDRDVWLSESFAEYSSGLYIQALQGEKRFQQQLTDWKRMARQADPMAPIALATTLGGETAGKYYTQLVYNKGPLVVHMIRTQIGNDKYIKTMTNVMTKYRHQNINTELLAKELSLVTGHNWDYFFDQWFRGVGIPEIHYKYKVTPKEGKYLFEMTLTQKDAENFKKILALPVVWKGPGKDQVARKDFAFGKQGQVIQAMLPFEPKEVEVDPDHNLLADIVQDKK
jgi:hypothetical protein